jgi:hypothetical protein
MLDSAGDHQQAVLIGLGVILFFAFLVGFYFYTQGQERKAEKALSQKMGQGPQKKESEKTH